MKVLMLNGSSHINGTTFTALNEIGKALNNEGIDYEIFQIGADAVRDCIGCNQCTPDGCAYTKDNVNEFIACILCPPKWKNSLFPRQSILFKF